MDPPGKVLLPGSPAGRIIHEWTYFSYTVIVVTESLSGFNPGELNMEVSDLKNKSMKNDSISKGVTRN
jgi:hypothetical protein